MANSEKLIRIVKMMSLIDRRQGTTLKFLAAECGVCERTVYRDIAALAEGELAVFCNTQTKSCRFTELLPRRKFTAEISQRCEGI